MTPPAGKNATVGHTCAQFRQYLKRAEALCRMVAGRDLFGVPLYIVPQSQLIPLFGPATYCYAYTCPSLDLYLRDSIENWLGRGPCLVINDAALIEDFDPDDHEELVLNHTLHELAHILDRQELFARRPVDRDRIVFESLVMESLNSSKPVEPAIVGHGLQFIRIAIHLAERANADGYDFRLAGVCPTHKFGLSPIDDYYEAIGDEVARNFNVRFRDFGPPPDQMIDLFNSDTQTRGGSK